MISKKQQEPQSTRFVSSVQSQRWKGWTMMYSQKYLFCWSCFCCSLQLVLPLHVKNDRQEWLGCASTACPEGETTMLTSSSAVRSDTILKVALHSPDSSILSWPFITIAVLQIKCTSLSRVQCNHTSKKCRGALFPYHPMEWHEVVFLKWKTINAAILWEEHFRMSQRDNKVYN